VGATTLLAAAFAGSGDAAEPAQEPLVRVDDAWVRGTVEGQTGSGAYMRLTSREDAVLTGASCADAQTVEIHEMKLVKDMMSMRKIDRLALPAHQTIGLDHDYHVMLIGLRRQLLAGQSLHLTLHVLDAKGKAHAIAIDAPIRPLNSPKPAATSDAKSDAKSGAKSGTDAHG
jgi:copper(I)-binding protein